MTFQFHMKDLLYCTAIVALPLGWFVDRNELNREAASLAVEVYKIKSRLRFSSMKYGGLFPPGMKAQYI